MRTLTLDFFTVDMNKLNMQTSLYSPVCSLTGHTLLADYIVAGVVSTVENVGKSASAEGHRRTVWGESVNTLVATTYTGVNQTYKRDDNKY